jgi:NDP-sugar pyrophosphorylase family protein
MDAIILCGGKGTRLASVLSDVPKPLAPVNGRPFMDFVLEYLEATGLFARVILATGHLGKLVEAHYGRNFGNLALEYSAEAIPLGTAGAVCQALRRFDSGEELLVVNGDSFVDVDLRGLRALSNRSLAAITMALHAVPDTSRFGTVVCDGERVINFAEKQAAAAPGLINAGFYWVAPGALNDWAAYEGPLSLELTVLPALVQRGLVAGIASGTRFIDIGLPETYAAAASFFFAP